MKQMRITISFLLSALLFSAAIFAQDEENCAPNVSMMLDSYKEAELSNPQQVAIWYSFATENHKNKQYKKAARYFKQVIANANLGNVSEQKFHRFSFNKLSEIYYEMARDSENSNAFIDSSLATTYEGLEKYSTYAQLRFRAATLQKSKGNTVCAIEQYDWLVNKYPDEANYYKILVELLLEQQDERAIEVQQNLIDIEDNYENQSKFRQILEVFGKDPIQALVSMYEKDPTNVDNANALAKEALIIGNYQMALQASSSALQADPANIKALDVQAKANESLGNMSEAIAAYRTITEVDPNNINALCALGLAYATSKNFSAARSQVLKAKRIDASNGLPYMTMGQIIEEAVDYCSNKRGKNTYSYDDNIVFELYAVAEYRKASNDANFAAKANSRINALRPFFRSKEDKFMKQNRSSIQDGCYNWLN